MNVSRKIDHIVYAVPNLEEAIDELEKRLGMRPTFGGYHDTQGTKNAVFHLGGTCYFEILAVDENNTNIPPPRWMGIDLISEPCITRWAIKSDDLHHDQAILQKSNPEMGAIKGGQRVLESGNLLKWELIMPLAKPTIEILPFMLDWSKSDFHPTSQLEPTCKLIGLKIYHPNSSLYQTTFQELGIDISIQQSNKIKIVAVIDSPNGVVELN